MAVKTLMLRKKINDKKRELESLISKRDELTSKVEELEFTEREIEQAINEAETDEEKETVEAAVNEFEANKSAIESEQTENAEAIENLEGEINELENELAESENRQAAREPAEVTPETVPATKHERNYKTMFKTRSLRNMTIEQREAFVAREDVQATISQIRELMKTKRSVTGGDYTIGTSVLALIRENVMEYSKLYSRVNAMVASGNGRVVVQGVAPEAIWLECCDAIPEVSVTFGQVELDCFKVGAYIGVCNALVEDSDIDLLDALMDAIMQALGIAIDKAILYGTGTKMPTGVLTAIADDQTLAATNLIKITGSPTGNALFTAIIKAAAAANSSYSRGSKLWIMNEKTYMEIMANAVSVNSNGQLVAGVSDVFPVVGGDIIVLNFVPDENIIVGYFDLYALLIRSGLVVETSEHAKFIEDQTVLRGKARMDGKPAIVGAFAGIGLGVDPTTTADFPGES